MTLRAAHEQFTSIEAVRALNTCGCINDEQPDDDTLDVLIDQASDTLCRLSMGRVYGRSEVTVRPCRIGCYDGCPCCGLDGIPLWGPDPVVSEVKINGVALDPDDYAIHQRYDAYFLVRVSTTTRPPSWPSWQELWKPDTETDTFSITYEYGVHVDWIIEKAAQELVCLFAKADETKKNKLQKGAISASYNSTQVSLEERVAQARGQGDSVAVGEFMEMFFSLYGAGPRSMVWAPELTDGWSFSVVSVPTP
jgi:hypothetical protein